MDTIGVFDAGTAGGAVGMRGFRRQEGRTAWSLISPRPKVPYWAAPLFMRARLQSGVCNYTAPPRFMLDTPRLVMVSSQAILFNRTGPISSERDVRRRATAIIMPIKDDQMSRRLHESFPKQTSVNVPGRPVMVYICECGVKWTNSLRPTWECNCGRQLEKRNGIIHAAIGQMSAQTARVPCVFLVANG